MSTETLPLPAVADSPGPPAVPGILLALAHEKRGLFSPIKVAADLLADPVSVDPPDLARLAAAVSQGVRWLEGLSEALVACAFVRCQNLNLQVREFSPQEWAQSVFQLVGPILARRGQQVCLHCPAPGLRIRGDPRWLGHLPLNPLSNATRHGIEVGVTGEGGRIRVSVSNHRIPAAGESDAVGEPAWPQRMGVGLQVARLIAALHGGRLGTAFGSGRRTVFWVDLPAGVKGQKGEGTR